MAASCGAGIVSALIPYSLGFAESLCFSDQEMIKIKLILGGEDGKLFGELLFFGFSVEHALLSPSCTHISPSQCRGKFPSTPPEVVCWGRAVPMFATESLHGDELSL